MNSIDEVNSVIDEILELQTKQSVLINRLLDEVYRYVENSQKVS